MTDAIAGLSENLRTPWKDSEGYFVLPSKRDLEAATALDALQADLQVKEQAIADLGRAIHKWQSERDALQARVKELEAQLAGADATLLRLNSGKELQDMMRLNNDLKSRALRAEQERDEAVALLVRVNALAQTQAWRRMPDGATFSTTPLAGDINTTIRRLAGPEKEGK